MPIKKRVEKKTVAPAVKVAKAKTSAKKSTPKKLIYAADPHSFWTTDGAILNSLTALRNALAAMDKEVFSHHVAKGKNDFADWVEVVLLDEECAIALRKAKTPATACAVVEKYLKLYHE